ncbi:hypothetical protein DFJ73DRAFT_893949 [Zopfochytrium polystomum]|nr:hypothetical protein DFJ73DRAFT_893949 [Zopfochytrium polystomum]
MTANTKTNEHLLRSPPPLAPPPDSSVGGVRLNSCASSSSSQQPFIVRSAVPDFLMPDVDISSLVLGPKRASDHPRLFSLDAPFLVDAVTGTSATYAQVLADVGRFTHSLRNVLAFKKWEVLAVFTPNHPDFIVVAHGTLRAGATLTTANPTYTADELAYQLKDSGATALVTSLEVLGTALIAADAASIPHSRVFVLTPLGRRVDVTLPAGVRWVRNTLIDPSSTLPPPPAVAFTKDELTNCPAYLCYSSGTTGRSKGVVLSHRNVVAATLQAYYFEKHFGQYVERESWLAVLPLYHLYGLFMYCHWAPFAGHRVVVMPKFELESYLRLLVDYDIGTTHIVPPIVVGLAKHPIVEKFKFPKLKRIMSAAAPLSSEVSSLVKSRLGLWPVQGYGMTETSPIGTLAAISTFKNGSSGILVPNMQLRLVDADTGRDVAGAADPGHPHRTPPGEIWLRGPNIMRGYHNNPAATAGTIDRDGWLHTGDVGVLDREGGDLFVVDRIKELIKYKGLQVAPAELEAVLLTHPKVADAAVIPRPDHSAGELPRAYVVLKPGAAGAGATAAEIEAHVAARVAPHKRLRGGVAFVDEIPKAASGKILRRVLRERERSEREGERRGG